MIISNSIKNPIFKQNYKRETVIQKSNVLKQLKAITFNLTTGAGLKNEKIQIQTFKTSNTTYLLPYVFKEESWVYLVHPEFTRWKTCFFDIHCIVLTEPREDGFFLSISVVSADNVELKTLPSLEEWYGFTDFDIYLDHSINMVIRYSDAYRNGVDNPTPTECRT